MAVLHLAKKAGIKKIKGCVKATESNWRMKPLFEKRGFKKVFDGKKIQRYEFDLKNKIKPYPN